MTRIALVTCTEAWREDDDSEPTLGALAAVGVDASLQVWDDPAVDWGSFDLVVIRSTWDYVPRRDEFLAWAERVGAATRLANPAPVLRWSTDKRYLAELADAGVPVVPTRWLAPGDDDAAIVDAVSGHADGFVVKPTVSAGSKDTIRYPGPTGDDDPTTAAAVAQARALLDAGRPVMVQPYLAEVDTRGETGVVVLSGEVSHAFRKGPLLSVGDGPVTDLYAREDISPRDADDAELDVVRRAVAVAEDRFGPLLYARIDLLPGDDGPVVIELELAEPSFFLATDPASPARVAAAFLAAATAP